jgi:protoporphyrinogen oxidase
VIGAGPTGLCAAYRLHELGYTNWELLEGTQEPAGLACTIRDQAGFGWDIGVHCLFSHFSFFDALLDDMLPPSDWLYHRACPLFRPITRASRVCARCPLVV